MELKILLIHNKDEIDKYYKIFDKKVKNFTGKTIIELLKIKAKELKNYNANFHVYNNYALYNTKSQFILYKLHNNKKQVDYPNSP